MSVSETVVPGVDEALLRPLPMRVAELSESDRAAFTFVDYAADRAGVAHECTWRELAARVRAVAAEVTARTEPGDRVAVLAPQDLDYVVAFLGTLTAGRIAVPLFAPEVSMHGGRLVGALADCAPTLWLTSSEALPQVKELATTEGVPEPADTVAVDTVDPAAGVRFAPPRLDLADPAYLQYTSGSTRDPAGAVITHRALATNTAQAIQAYGVDETFSCVGWIPFFHDMGLVQLLCLPVAAGARGVFTTPFSFIRKPVRWLRMMAEYPNTMSAAPNFAFELAAKKVSDADRATLDLSGVKVVVNGAEPVRAGTIEQFAEVFGPQGFPLGAHRPSYGLAEATVFVSTGDGSGPVITHFDRPALTGGRAVRTDPATAAVPPVTLVSAGGALGQLVRIVHPDSGVLCDDDQVGEIWIHGANVASGYWQAPERSAETFDAAPADPPAELPARGWLRTGDLGLLQGGQLYITGRIKDLIIIDGKNHYPQDLEATAQDAHPAIRRDHVAAFAVDNGDIEGAVVIAERQRGVESADVDIAEVTAAVRRAVTAVHDVKLVDFQLVQPGGVLRTSSGKVARSATRARYLESLQGKENV